MFYLTLLDITAVLHLGEATAELPVLFQGHLPEPELMRIHYILQIVQAV